jgi:dTDP-4-dehydrorhamnose 3,5-epimerase
MIFRETDLEGAYIIQPERKTDERGFFARCWCKREFEERGLCSEFVQCNISFNETRGTLRGMHYQAAPHEEVKLIRCTRGSIFDVMIDLRRESPTYMRHQAVTLDMDNHLMIYVPEGFAQGFLTLEDRTEVYYQMSEYYVPGHARGVRWDDPAFGVEWPFDPRVILDRDAGYPDFEGAEG